MLIPNTTGQVAHTSRETPPGGVGAKAGQDATAVERVVRDLEVIAWQEREDGRVVPLVIDTDGRIADATGLDGFEGIYPAPRSVASADGWFAEFLGTDGKADLVPVAVWATLLGEVVGMLAGANAVIENGTLVSSGDRDLYPAEGANFVRYVHASELSPTDSPG